MFFATLILQNAIKLFTSLKPKDLSHLPLSTLVIFPFLIVKLPFDKKYGGTAKIRR